jgi:hypothetical protein
VGEGELRDRNEGSFIRTVHCGEPSKGQRKDCREGTDAAVLSVGYTTIASKIADRLMMLSGYRLADLLRQMQLN